MLQLTILLSVFLSHWQPTDLQAINISIQDLPAKIASIEQYKYSEILVYCSHGHRSEQAAYLLNQSGFKKVTNMLGGMSVVPNSTCKN